MRDRRDSFRVGLGSFESSFLVVMSLAVFLGWVSLTSFSSFFLAVFFRLRRRFFPITPCFSDCHVSFRMLRIVFGLSRLFPIAPSYLIAASCFFFSNFASLFRSSI